MINQNLVDELFPSLKEVTHLNNAGVSIPPVTAKKAMMEYFENRMKGKFNVKDVMNKFKEFGKCITDLLGGGFQNYAYMPNTTAGINAIANSIDYPTGSNIVICDLEFPANYIPWLNLKNFFDVEVRVVKSKDGAAPVDEYIKLIDENTRMVAVSHVQFGTGYKIDIKKLADAVHSVGGYISLDIIQSAGCVDFKIPALDVDFAAGQATKWLLGPIGAGFIYVRDELLEKVKPRYMGWQGVKNTENFSFREIEPASSAAKFQLGSPAMICYWGLTESLKVLLKFPGEAREKAALENADYLRKRLDEKGIGHLDFKPENRSAIVSCNVKDAENLIKVLWKNNVICSVRDGNLRVSPHFYNSKDDIDRLMEFL
ncbi:MAG: aminotransferase class V-fold PLP-dependent enzyme [Candidatus Hodarchaeota archaeon]